MAAQRLIGVVGKPIAAFFRLEAASGILLLIAAVIAMAWANSPWADAYHHFVDYPMSFTVGPIGGKFTLHQFVNDALMAIFFFVVGLEIKRELVVGELNSFSKAMLPLIAALGGMVIPAGIYVAFNIGKPGINGWAIPMATDIAFCIGILTLLGSRVPRALVVFLTALAIFDDIGGIMVIAIFYGTGLHIEWLFVAGGIAFAMFMLNVYYVRAGIWYFLLAVPLWYSIHHAGIHATIAGVVAGMLVPAKTNFNLQDLVIQLNEYVDRLMKRRHAPDFKSHEVLGLEDTLEHLEPPLTRFEQVLHPYVAYFVMPLFALVNAGVSMKGVSLSDFTGDVVMGTILGLFVGKLVGIFVFTWVALKLKLSVMPGNARNVQLLGVSAVGGIGFTVALFIATLAFPNDSALLREAKIGILVASLIAGIVGFALLRFTSQPTTLRSS